MLMKVSISLEIASPSPESVLMKAYPLVSRKKSNG
jgi:hypothetical protein